MREYQASIAESVKQLLADKIRRYGLEPPFSILETEIRGPFESLITFKGLQGSRAHSLRSLEGYDIAEVEEAQAISQSSLDTMTPTFRRSPGMVSDPEMWFIWNPISPKDPVERLFQEHEPDDPDFICVTVNYHDNPWFPEDLRRDMLRDRVRNPDRYAHVWLGAYQKHSQARVFRNWRIEEFETPSSGVRFYYGADWGFSIDPSVLVRCWIRGHELFIDYEAYQVGCKIENLPALFLKVPEAKKWPIVADSSRPDTIDFLIDRGFKMRPSVKGAGSVEEGIEFLESYDIVIHPRCEHTIDEFSTYSWKIDQRTNEVLPTLEDKNNHLIDSVRYSLEGVRHAGTPLILSPKALQQFQTQRDRFGGGMRNRFARI